MTDESCELLCLDLPEAERVRSLVPSAEVAGVSAARLRALADPTRLRVAMALAAAGGELCVCDLAWVVGTSSGLVSHHLRLLRSSGLAASRRDGKMVMYTLSEPGEALLRSVTDSTVGSQVTS
ncbi:metalloregulator ArsR/SmtB family transcription factor [Nocardioides sp. P86]|uniref:ArsR/SmtB family transcription factor n=1 Tax=Nocardioides sp. P86 TaxID=2939569 RepID=UPI00203F31BB|nr:metalloregulator ArsR/SmtB family transcription factor [Nocardioides sp. P86]MCM3515143.1 metalloregulator ArsR/SmtB family transcription factor [Nocardioides sp. P86]